MNLLDQPRSRYIMQNMLYLSRRSLIRYTQKIWKVPEEWLGSRISWKFISIIYWPLQGIIVTHSGIIILPISALDNTYAKWFVINCTVHSSKFWLSKIFNFNSLTHILPPPPPPLSLSLSLSLVYTFFYYLFDSLIHNFLSLLFSLLYFCFIVLFLLAFFLFFLIYLSFMSFNKRLILKY